MISSCTASVTGGVRTAGYVVVALAEAPGALDPTQASTYVGRIVFANMCEKLYDVNSKLAVVPQLAAALPTISPDGRTYTIRLRTGVRFNDGTPMDASAVKMSLDRDRTDKLSQRKSELKPVVSVDVVDPQTVRINLLKPFAPLTTILADRSGMVLSPTALRAEGDNFGRHPVCVGPFSFSSEPDPDEINLVRSTYYYGRDQVTIPGITFRVITQPNVRATDLRSGDVDVVDRAAPQDVTTLQDDPDLRVQIQPSLGYQGIYINIGNAHGTNAPAAPPDTPLAQHPTLRTAFELSLDRDVINKVVFEGAYVPVCSPIPPISTYAVNVPCSKRDIAQARQLVAASGVPTPIPVTLSVNNDALDEQLATVIQAMAKDAGFDVKVRPTEFTTLLSDGQNGKFDTMLEGWSGRLDPDQNISQMYLPGSALNYSGNSDPTIDALIQQGRTTLDPAARKKIYQQLVVKANQELAIMFVYDQALALGVRKGITGIDFYGDGLIRLAHARVTR